MTQMKLRELLPVGKITSRKPLNEIVHIDLSGTGVVVGVDDYDDVTFVPGKGGLDIPTLGKVIETLEKSRWFIQLVIKMSKTIHVGDTNAHKVRVDFDDSGIHFNWR